MANKQNETKDNKITLHIESMMDSRKFKETTIIRFKDQQGATNEVWSEKLTEYIIPGGDIICDRDNWETVSGDNTYKNHKITQIYVDDKPVYEKKSWSGGGGGYQDSPEKRHSIEQQNAFTGLIQLICAGKCPEDLEKLAFAHANQKMKPFVAPANPPDKAPEATKSKSTGVKADTKAPVFDGKAFGLKLERLSKEVPDIWAVDKIKFLLGQMGGKGEKVSGLLKTLAPVPFNEFVESVNLAITNLDIATLFEGSGEEFQIEE